ncbi:MAG: hypothetical protein J6T53_06075 [Bacteroidales bacterium]|nr:hypothetical protein [Bacteroidales bacterium]
MAKHQQTQVLQTPELLNAQPYKITYSLTKNSNRMKKTLFMIVAAAFTMAFAACGNKS